MAKSTQSDRAKEAASITGAACDLPPAKPAEFKSGGRGPQGGNQVTASGGEGLTGTSAQPGISSQAGATERAKNVLSDAAQRAKETVKGAASSAAEEVQEQSASWAQDRKNRLADEFDHLSSAMRTATESLRRDNDGNVAEYTELVSRRIERAGEYLRTADVGRIQHDVERFARKRPELFFGGLFLVGLGISRFLKAGSGASQRAIETSSNNVPAMGRHPGMASHWSEQ